MDRRDKPGDEGMTVVAAPDLIWGLAFFRHCPLHAGNPVARGPARRKSLWRRRRGALDGPNKSGHDGFE